MQKQAQPKDNNSVTQKKNLNKDLINVSLLFDELIERQKGRFAVEFLDYPQPK
jgi:hypothetical protein